jgi:hypothetical protein
MAERLRRPLHRQRRRTCLDDARRSFCEMRPIATGFMARFRHQWERATATTSHGSYRHKNPHRETNSCQCATNVAFSLLESLTLCLWSRAPRNGPQNTPQPLGHNGNRERTARYGFVDTGSLSREEEFTIPKSHKLYPREFKDRLIDFRQHRSVRASSLQC